MAKFKAGQRYEVDETIIDDGSTPSKDSIIEITEIIKGMIYYKVIEGNQPSKSECRFTRKSNLASKVKLIE